MLKKMNEAPQALDALQKSQAIMVQLTTRVPGNAGWKQQLAWLNGQIAQLAPVKP